MHWISLGLAKAKYFDLETYNRQAIGEGRSRESNYSECGATKVDTIKKVTPERKKETDTKTNG